MVNNPVFAAVILAVTAKITVFMVDAFPFVAFIPVVTAAVAVVNVNIAMVMANVFAVAVNVFACTALVTVFIVTVTKFTVNIPVFAVNVSVFMVNTAVATGERVSQRPISFSLKIRRNVERAFDLAKYTLLVVVPKASHISLVSNPSR